MQSKHLLEERCKLFLSLHVLRMSAEVTSKVLNIIPVVFYWFGHTRSCQRELNAWLNTDFLHHSWTESSRGIYRCRRAPLSVWLYCPSSSLQHLDVSHLQRKAQSTIHHKISVAYIAWKPPLLRICLSCKHRQRGPGLMLTPTCWLLPGHCLYRNSQSKGQK